MTKTRRIINILFAFNVAAALGVIYFITSTIVTAYN